MLSANSRINALRNVFPTITGHTSAIGKACMAQIYIDIECTNQNYIQEEIKCRLKTGNSVQTLLSSKLLSKFLKIKIYKTIIFPVVLYGCEAWSLALREECRLRVLENRILRRIFGPERNENMKWRRLHNEELHSLYRSPNIV